MSLVNYIRLPLKNAYNVRDLGGYACGNEKATKWRKFIRADDLANLDDNEVKFLIDYGVTCVIDLRSQEECNLQMNPFVKSEAVDYANIPLMTNVITDVSKTLLQNPQKFLSNFYIELIKNASLPIKSVFEKIANHITNNDESCILFHCSAGKDRTGIISMLLLGLAGVEIPDIISNYEVTYTYIKQNPVFKNATPEYPVDVLMSKSEYIEYVLDYIITTHTSILKYLQYIGLTDRTLGIIHKQICI